MMKPGDVITPANDEITVTTLGQGVGKQSMSYSHHWSRGALLILIERTRFKFYHERRRREASGMAGWLVKEPGGDIGFLPDDYAQLCEVIVAA